MSRLTGLEWAFLLTMVLPLLAYQITLRSIRVVQRGPMEEALRWIDVYKSDLFFTAGFAVLGLALLLACRGRLLRWPAFVFLQVCTAIISAVELSAFQFFLATGSTIDFQLIWFSISQLTETFDVVASETPAYVWWMQGLSLLVVAASPWAFFGLWRRFVAPRLPARDAPRSLRRPLIVAATGLVLLGLSTAPPFVENSYAFARNAFVNVAMSAGYSVSETFAGAAVSNTDTKRARLVPRTAEAGRKNVVVILLESTRARSVSVYDPSLGTTPHLEKLAEKSLVAEHAYTIVPHTSKALVASLCGIEPRLHMPITEGMPDGIPGKCLARLLAESGYRTAFFQSATERFENRQTVLDNMGYETFEPLEHFDKKGWEKVNYFGQEDDIMLEPSSSWIDEVKNEPFFLTYLTLTPHHNYLAPRRYGRHKFHPNNEINRYLNSVHYVDAFVNNVIEMFKEKGLYENTIFVILGDHGEGFGEHGRRQHDNVIWEEGLHIPLLVHDPSRWQEGKRLDHLVNQLDIIPTVADLLGYDITDATFPGDSMVGLDRDRTMRAHCWYERRCMASIYKREKFIYHFDQQPDEFFDLASDPLEKNNIVGTLPDAQRRRSDLIMWRARVNAMYRAHNQGRLEQHVFDKAPVVAQERDATFGEWARLIGVDVPTEPVKPGQAVKITFYYEVLDRFPDGWKLFVHGEGKGSKMKNFDHVPVDGLYPLEDWRRGQFVADSQTIRIPADAKDEYVLWTGFFHGKKGRVDISGATEVVDKRAKAAVIPLQKVPPRKIKPKMLKPPQPQPNAPLPTKPAGKP